MLTKPGIATFSSAQLASLLCSSCNRSVYQLKPYEVVYPRNSVGRALGKTHTVKGECQCGSAYQFPVTSTV